MSVQSSSSSRTSGALSARSFSSLAAGSMLILRSMASGTGSPCTIARIAPYARSDLVTAPSQRAAGCAANCGELLVGELLLEELAKHPRHVVTVCPGISDDRTPLNSARGFGQTKRAPTFLVQQG